MGVPDYRLLKQTLKLDVAIRWLDIDAKDDFYPDPINFADLRTYASEYLTNREYRMLQIDTYPYWKEFVPKKSGMLREAIWLHPVHRILFLSILRHLLARLDSKILPEVYSYRLDEPYELDKYPFGRRMDRWKQFHNDFREAALDPSTGAVLLTDIASYYDHISCDQMCMRIGSMLGLTIDETDEAMISLLGRLLAMWSTDVCGIPHNYDPSSFFGSLYLHNVDHEMVSNRYLYFRWVDDIRIVTKSKEQAIRALQFLQRTLAQYRLFLATDKTYIFTKDDPRFANLLDVEDDQVLSNAEEIIASGDRSRIETIIDQLFSRLEFHAGPDGDDRKFRAFANRLLDTGDYAEIKQNIHPRLREFVIPRLITHPERSDYWTKLLSVEPSNSTIETVQRLLADQPSMFDWQRFHLWKLALYLPKPLPRAILDKAIAVSGSRLSEAVAAQAIVFVGKHGDNTQRELLFGNHFTPQSSTLAQRAVLIAIQELPERQKEYLFKRALEINSDHMELVKYLSNLSSPNYGEKLRTERHCMETPRKVETYLRRGIGLVGGKIVRFRLSRRDYDYE